MNKGLLQRRQINHWQACEKMTIRRTQSKTTIRYHFMLVRMAIEQQKHKQKILTRDVEKEELCALLVGMQNSCGHYRWYSMAMAVSQKNGKQNYHMTQQSHSCVYSQKMWKQGLKKIFAMNPCSQQHYYSQKVEAPPVFTDG